MLDVRFTVMIVEDSIENQQLIEGMLIDEYDVVSVPSGDDCLEKIEEQLPDVILMDVKMPGINGYETCRKLKASQRSREIPVIFVSGSATQKERLKGYESGGDDYVAKPFDADELVSKVARALLAKQEQLRLKNSIADAQRVAQRALISSSELGGLNLFMQQCGNSMSYEELADHLLRAIRAFGLQSSLVIRGPVETYYFGCEPDSVEVALLMRGRNAERFVELQSRTLVNSPNCSILINNMPLDELRGGELRQYLGVIIDSTTARIDNLQTILDLEAQRTTTIRNLIKTNDTSLLQLRDKYVERENEERRIMQNLRAEVERQLVENHLAEQNVIASVVEGARQIQNLPDLTPDIESSLRMTGAMLKRLLD